MWKLHKIVFFTVFLMTQRQDFKGNKQTLATISQLSLHNTELRTLGCRSSSKTLTLKKTLKTE